MIKHNHSIKKLSTAIARGYKMAQERGIEQGRTDCFVKGHDGIAKACALGMAFIGRFGITAAKESYSDSHVFQNLRKAFNIPSRLEEEIDPLTKTYRYNDHQRMNPAKIALKVREMGY